MNIKLAFLAQYSKTLVAAASTLAIIGETVSDGIVSQTEAGAIATSAIATFGVWRARNKPKPVV